MSGWLLAVALACGGEPPASVASLPVCGDGPARTPSSLRPVSLRVLVGPGVEPGEVAARIDQQQALAAKLGVALEVVGAVATIELLAPVAGTSDEVAGVWAAADPKDSAAHDAIARAIFTPALDLLRARADAAAADAIDLVVTQRLVAGGSPARDALAGLAAFTLSPRLPADPSTAGGFDLHNLLPEHYRPTIFVSWSDWSAARAAAVDSLLLHEVGHALGLAHVQDPDNLMGPRRWSSCLPVLDDAQRRAEGVR